MATMDLDKDYTINGHEFQAGKGVDVSAYDTDSEGKSTKVDYGNSIKELQAQEKELENIGGHTHGVPTMKDPTTPTSGTPTRPDGNGKDGKLASDPIPEEEK